MVQALKLRAAAGRAAAAGVLENETALHGQQRRDRHPWNWRVSDIALSDGPLLPPTAPRTHGRVHTQLHQRAGCACADPVPRNVAHACRGPRKSGRDACPVAGRASGTPAMARGAVSADPRGSCHQPRRYHVKLSYTWLRRPILLGGARGAATVESTPLLSITALTLGFITVYITCTTVASRVAANACATHLCFLTEPLLLPCHAHVTRNPYILTQLHPYVVTA